MRVLLLLALIAASLAGADAFRLYLKSGEFHTIREYKVAGERISYFSTERGEWEEIPTDLVDLPKTEAERKQTHDLATTDARELADEEKAERALRKELAAIPDKPGAYYIDGEQIKNVASSDYKVVTDKKRQVIKVLSPIPLVPGRASVVIAGEHSGFAVTETRPQFYFRLAKEETFGIVKLTPKKNARIVENISVVPVANQSVEEQKEIATFQQQMSDGLFKVWPEKNLTPGEYALIEYTQGEVSLMIWDFAYKPQTDSKN